MIRRPHSRLLVAMAAAVLAATACEKKSITLDSGDPSTLQVLVYVDADGNGVFDAGVDEPIASATVTASGPVDVSGTTDASGAASLTGLVPGSYTLSLAATPPSGAVLATASSPVVVADFRGGSLQTEFRYTFMPGSIAGRLFRDDNENGVFDADADLPAAGIGVMAERSGDGSEFETLTSDDGAFELAGLRPGTYSVTFGLPEDAEVVGGEPATVVVSAATPATLQAIFTGELVVDIADARDAPSGQSVTVEGTVTWHKSWDSRAYWVEDETGGIAVFDFDRPDLAEGDRVRLTGERGAFDGDIQISPVNSLEVIGGGGPPVPTRATGAEVNGGAVTGRLVSVNGTVTSVEIVNSFGTQLVTLEDDEGTEFDVFADNRTGLTESDWQVGSLFGVTGVVVTDDDEDPMHRVQPRTVDDVQLGGATSDIADVRSQIGATVAVQGIVTWAPSFDDRVLFLQDGTGGISLFDFDLSDFEPEGGFMRGHHVRIVATVGAFGGETQLEDVSDVTVLGLVAVPSPMGTTGAAINAGEDQGELVIATGTVASVDVLSFGNQLVTLTDAADTDFNVYVDSRTGVGEDDWTVGDRYRVAGVLGANDSNTPAARIEVRGPEDVTNVGAGDAISIAEARAMGGETVTISGTVTRVPSWDSRSAFVQDGTGGIAVFSFDGLGGVAAGDMVTITGEIGAFNGEVQIGPDEITVDGTGAVPDPLVVTGRQVVDGLFQGQLVSLAGTVQAVEVINSFGSQEVTLLHADGNAVTVFVDNRTGLLEGDWTVGQSVTVVGILGYFDGNDPPAQLELYRETDVTFGS